MLKKSYWLSHRSLRSKAKVYYGDIYRLPAELGAFDVAVFGTILTHLRDPFTALEQAARLSNHIIVTSHLDPSDRAAAVFLNDYDTPNLQGWWSVSEKCVRAMLGTLGFDIIYTGSCNPTCLVKDQLPSQHYYVVIGKKCPPGAPRERATRDAAQAPSRAEPTPQRSILSRVPTSIRNWLRPSGR